MDYFQRFLQMIRVSRSDEELGNRTAVYPTDGRRATVATYQTEEYHIEVSEKLQEFRLLIGITTHGSYKAPRGFNRNQRPVVTTSGRPAPNMGVYATVGSSPSITPTEYVSEMKLDSEIKQKKTYKMFSRLINGCLGLQIIVAAALTALGAANGSRSAVTVFGAINTVIAGFLTYLKGSGLPGRFQYFQHEWTKVREYIEQRERDLSLPNDINVLDEVRYIRHMFENVRDDIESSRPDRFIGSSGRKHGHLGVPASSSNTLYKTDTAGLGVDSGFSDALSRLKTATGNMGHVEGTVTADLSRLKDRLRQKMSEIEGLEMDIDSHSKKVIESKEAKLSKAAEDKINELGDLEKNIESFGRQTVEKNEHEVELKATDAAVDAAGRIQATIELKDSLK